MIQLLESNGFKLLIVVGTIPVPHPKKDIPVGIYNYILKKVGLK